jgi:hypothetical protein
LPFNALDQFSHRQDPVDAGGTVAGAFADRSEGQLAETAFDDQCGRRFQ